LGKVFEKSKILSDINKSLLYFNMPYDTILKDRTLPVLLFPPANSDQRLPMLGQVLDFFEKKQAHLMANVIIMQVEIRGEKVVIGGFSSHGWLKDGNVTQTINGKLFLASNVGMDLTMKFGGDESCFLFNLSQNLRFDTLKNSDFSARDLPVFSSTVIANGYDSHDESIDAEEEPLSGEEASVDFGRQQKPRKVHDEPTYNLSFGEQDLVISVTLYVINSTLG